MKGRVIAGAWLTVLIACFGLTAAYGAGNPVIGDGSKVTVHYQMASGGEILDDSRDGEPMTFAFGEKRMMPAFQENLRGLKPGDKKSFTLQPEDAFGMPDPAAIVLVPRTQLPEGEIEEGMVFSAMGEGGIPVRGTVVEVLSDQVRMDFNHPLAGKILDFEVEVIGVE